MKYRCKCGNISEITFNSFKSGRRCHECWIKKHSGKNNYQWIKDRKLFKEIYDFKQKCYKMLKYSLKKTKQVKNDRTHRLLGYTPSELRQHIYNHPNWKKVKNKSWHMDHIFPIKAFLDYGIKDLKLINCLDNLQPLLAVENTSKNDSYDRKLFEEWLVVKKYEF